MESAALGDWRADYAALTDHAGLIDLSERSKIELRGDDRARFLHNFCTNDIRRLSVGAGCEAFITTGQGRILAFVLVFAGPDTLVLDAESGQAEKIIAHLDRYVIREKVEFQDRSAEWAEWLLAGPDARSLLENCGAGEIPGHDLAHVASTLGGQPVWLRRVEAMASTPGFLIVVPAEYAKEVAQALEAAGARGCGRQAAEALRVEAGFPRYGVDITEKNLPQEVARDERAISFVKGCYLGQETVARIDALGHVNKTLCGLRFSGPQAAPAGAQLSHEGQSAGEVTSSAFSPRLGTAVGLGYVRRGMNALGTQLEGPTGAVQIVALPLVR